MKPSLSLKRIGIWTGAFEPQPARKVQETVAELEELGYGAVWLSTLGAVPRAHAEEGCTLVTLKGAWGFLLNGTIIGFGPIAIEGVAQFDSAGNFSRDERAVVNGNVLPPKHITGTYTVGR